MNTLAPASSADEARALLEREYDEWRERDEPRSARALWGLAWVEFWAGRWELAAEHAARAHDISIQYGLEMPQDHLPIALDRRPSRPVRARPRAFGARARARGGAVRRSTRRSTWRSSGSSRSGAETRRRRRDWLDRGRPAGARSSGWGEPSVRWWTADYVEAAARARADRRRGATSSTPGRRTRRGSAANGCSRT